MSGTTTVGRLRAIITANSEEFKAEMAKVKRELGGVSRTFRKVGSSMKSTGRTLSTNLTLPILGMGAMIVRTAGKFESSMNYVRALTKASGDDFDKLKRKARDLGRDTQFSAGQAGDAMGYLAQAGLGVNEIMAAVPETLNLAAAAKLDLADATDRALKVMSGYRMTVKDLGRINDVLAKTSSSVNTTIVDLTEAFFKVGPLAKSAGMSFEATASVLGQLQDAGFQGAEAGTALKAILGGILNPSKDAAKALAGLGVKLTDAKGKMLPFTEVMKQLKPVANDTGKLLKLFGKRGGPGMAALLGKGAPAIKKLQESLKGAGGEAARIATERMKGFEGSMKALVSAFEEVQIAIAESGLLDTITKVVQRIAGFFRDLSKTSPELLKWGTIIAGVVAALGPAIWVMGAMVTAIGTIAPVIATVATAIAGFLGGPITLLIAAAAAIAAAWYKWGDQIKKEFPETFKTIKEVVGLITGVVKGMGKVFLDVVGDLPGVFGKLKEEFPETFAAIKEIVGLITDVMGSLGKMFLEVVGEISKAFGVDLGITMDGAKTAWEVFKTALVVGIKIAVMAIEAVAKQVKETVQAIRGAWDAIGPLVIAAVKAMIDGIKEQLIGRFTRIVAGVAEKVNAVGGYFKGLWDKVTKHSYVPDMIKDIRDEFAKLEGQMVKPAQAQTRKVSELFGAMKQNVAGVLKSLSGKLMSQAIGGFGGAGQRSGLFGGIQNLFGFAHGGSFSVAGAGGVDSQVVAFRATPGERVTVDPNGGGGGGLTLMQTLNFHPGVPETVRAEIRRVIPEIRQSTLSAVQDQVQRGGGFSRAVRGR